jgi:hypothetical protein
LTNFLKTGSLGASQGFFTKSSVHIYLAMLDTHPLKPFVPHGSKTLTLLGKFWECTVALSKFSGGFL